MIKKSALLIIPALTMTATALADAVTPTTVVIHPDTWAVDLRVVGSVGAVVLTGVWWLRAWMVKVDTRLDDQDKQRDRIEVTLENLSERIESLPCHAGECHKKK